MMSNRSLMLRAGSACALAVVACFVLAPKLPGEPPPSTPTAAAPRVALPPSAQPIEAAVTVDAGTQLGEFPRSLLGICLVPWNDFSAPLAEASRPILAGSVVRIWGRDVHANLDRCMQFVRATGAAGVIFFPTDEVRPEHKDKRVYYRSAADTNLVAGQFPKDLAAWVEYANKQPHEGFPKGYGIRYLEVWNEPFYFGDWEPEDYARYVADCAKAIREVDPDVKIGVHIRTDLPWGITGLDIKDAWTERLAAALDWSCVDFLIPHYYNHFTTFLQGSPTEYYSRVGATGRIRDIIRGQKALVAKYAGGRKIEFVVSEWNLHPKSYQDPGSQTRDMTAGIFAASMLQLYAEEGIDAATFFQLWSKETQNGNHFGMMGDGDGKIRRPTYQVLRLYAEHSGPVRLKSTVQTPTFPWVNPHNPRKERWEVPYVSGMATRTADGKALHLILVNKHPESPAKVAVTITGGAAPGEAGWTCLEAEPGNPERCRISQSKLTAQGDAQRLTFTVDLPRQSVSALDIPGK